MDCKGNRRNTAKHGGNTRDTNWIYREKCNGDAMEIRRGREHRRTTPQYMGYCEGNTTGYKWDTKGIQSVYKGNAKRMRRECKGENTKGVHREYIENVQRERNTERTQWESNGDTMGMQRVYVGSRVECKGKTNETQREYKGNAMGIQPENREGIQSECKERAKRIQKERKGDTKGIQRHARGI